MDCKNQQNKVDYLATVVMGWEWLPPSRTLFKPGCWLAKMGNEIADETWNPFTSISDAWELVEEIRQHKMFSGYRLHGNHIYRKHCFQLFWEHEEKQKEFREFNRNPAAAISEAICEAFKMEGK